VSRSDPSFFLKKKTSTPSGGPQIRGAFHFLGPGIGVFTNLQEVLFLLPDPKNKRFIISPLLKWTDQRVLTCMVGMHMNYIAVDTKDHSHGFSVIEALAPQEECHLSSSGIRRA
jgi:hypothetical protein